jgi:hypothetical protein
MKTYTQQIVALGLAGILAFACMAPTVVSAFTDAEEAACQKQSGTSCADKDAFSSTSEEAMKEALDAAEAKDLEAQCQKAYKKSCAEAKKDADGQKMASGQGFKLPLGFLTVTQTDKDGNAVPGTTSGTSIFSNNKYKSYGVLTGLLLRVIDILVYVIGSVAMLTFIVAGIFMITNHGDEAWVTKGKDMMFYSILGVLFALLSFIVVNVVTSLLS